jgi:hypothetical protein
LRRIAAVAGAAAVAGGAVVAGVGWLGHGDHAAASAGPSAAPGSLVAGTGTAPTIASGSGGAGFPAASAPAARTDWSGVMAALDAARDGAFENADAAALDGVYLPGSPAGEADRRTLGQLVAAGAHASGLSLELTSVTVESQTSQRVVLLVRDALPGYDIVAVSGARRHVAGRGERSWIVTLSKVGGSWRIDTVTAAPGPSASAR